MSAFLGPIHHWLYKKIQFQNQLTERILELNEIKGFVPDLKNLTDKRYGSLPEGALEELIDTDNIHGWLQDKVSLVENRLAFCVTSILNAEKTAMDDMMALSRTMGEELAPENIAEAPSAYQALDSYLLNGMPCDHVNQIIDQDSQFFLWEQTTDIHESYWHMVGGDVSYYHRLIFCFMEGFLKPAGFCVEKRPDNLYEIRRNSSDGVDAIHA